LANLEPQHPTVCIYTTAFLNFKADSGVFGKFSKAMEVSAERSSYLLIAAAKTTFFQGSQSMIDVDSR
jgi:hypothetical protein